MSSFSCFVASFITCLISRPFCVRACKQHRHTKTHLTPITRHKPTHVRHTPTHQHMYHTNQHIHVRVVPGRGSTGPRCARAERCHQLRSAPLPACSQHANEHVCPRPRHRLLTLYGRPPGRFLARHATRVSLKDTRGSIGVEFRRRVEVEVIGMALLPSCARSRMYLRVSCALSTRVRLKEAGRCVEGQGESSGKQVLRKRAQQPKVP